MNLDGIEGLTPEVAAQILARHNEDVSGLIKNRDDLKAEKTQFEEVALERQKQTDEARQLAADAEEATLKAKGDTEGLRQHYEKQLAENTAELAAKVKESQGALLERDTMQEKAIVLSLVSGEELHQEVAANRIDQALSITYENGKPVKTYTVNGVVVAKDTDSFISWAKENESWKAVLKGVNSSGAGKKQASGGFETTVNASPITSNYLASTKSNF